MDDSSDAALAAEGDFEAFERLYRKYLSRVYSLCARLAGSRHRGIALTEDVFVEAWDDLPLVPPDTPFASWLHRLATGIVVRREGMVRGNVSTADSGSLGTESARDPTQRALSRGLELSQAIETLPPDARGILVLHDVEGYQHSEIAQIFGITVGASKARLQRARVLLKETLGR
jgi:RNA polymerase sigma-70 factor (ECF subfamily)